MFNGTWANMFVGEKKIREYCTTVGTPIDKMFDAFDTLLLTKDMTERLGHLKLKGKIFVCTKVWSCIFCVRSNSRGPFAQETMKTYNSVDEETQFNFCGRLQHGGAMSLDTFIATTNRTSEQPQEPKRRTKTRKKKQPPSESKEEPQRPKRRTKKRKKKQPASESKEEPPTKSKQQAPSTKRRKAQERAKTSGVTQIAYFRAADGEDVLPQGKCGNRLCQIVSTNTDPNDTDYSPAWYQFVFLP